MTTRNTNGVMIKKIRSILGLGSQEALARFLEVSSNSVGRWERGENVPTFTLPQVAKLDSALREKGYTLSEVANSTVD